VSAEVSDGVQPLAEATQALLSMKDQACAKHKLLVHQQRPEQKRGRRGLDEELLLFILLQGAV